MECLPLTTHTILVLGIMFLMLYIFGLELALENRRREINRLRETLSRWEPHKYSR